MEVASRKWARPGAANASPAVAVIVTLVGVGFNLARLGLRLDHAPLIESVIAFLALGLAAAMIGWVLGMRVDELGLRLPRLLPGVLGGAAASAVLIGTAVMTAQVTRLPTAGQLVEGVVLFGLCTAPAEELMFRGVLYAAVSRRAGPLTAVIVSSTAFAVAHVPIYGLVSLPPALAAGLLLGWLRWWSGSLLPPVMVHAVADLALLWL